MFANYDAIANFFSNKAHIFIVRLFVLPCACFCYSSIIRLSLEVTNKNVFQRSTISFIRSVSHKLAQLQPSRLFSSMPLMFALLVLPFQQTFLEFHVLHIVQCRPSLSFQLALQIEFWRREFSPYYWPVFKCSATYTLQLEPPPPCIKGGRRGGGSSKNGVT